MSNPDLIYGPHSRKCVCELCWPIYLAQFKAQAAKQAAKITPEMQQELDCLITEILSGPCPEPVPLPTPADSVYEGMPVQFHTRGTENGRFGTVVRTKQSDGRRIEVRLESTADDPGLTVFTDNNVYSCLTEVIN